MDKIADEFINKLTERLKTLQPGDPMDVTATLAPVSSEGALIELLDQVNRAVENGATLVYGGKRLNREGAYMEPALLTNLSNDNP